MGRVVNSRILHIVLGSRLRCACYECIDCPVPPFNFLSAVLICPHQ